MRRRDLVGLLAAGGAAGCLRLASEDAAPTPGGAADDGPAGPPVTEAPGGTVGGTPTGTEPAGGSAGTATADAFPTGLSADGVSGELADAHLAALVGERFRHSVRIGDPAAGWQRAEASRVAGFEAISTATAEGPITMYQSTDAGLWREEVDGTVTYGQLRRNFNLGGIIRFGWLQQLLRAGDWAAPTRVETDDGPRFDIVASAVDDVGGLEQRHAGLESVGSFEATGRVDADGVVRSLEAVYQFTVPRYDSPVHRLYRHEITDLGTVSVERPSWLETARERAPEVAVRFVEDGRFVELAMESGNPMLPASTVTVWSARSRTNVVAERLAEPVEPGQRLYAYVEDGEGRLARDEPPAEASPDRLEGDHNVWVDRAFTRATYFTAELR